MLFVHHPGKSFELLEAKLSLSGNNGDVAAIIGGELSQRGDWPWIVSLQSTDSSHFCGASLIAPDTVLTAAHCVEGLTPGDSVALVGRQDLSADDGEQIGISEIMVHPKYDEFTNDFDAAILLLDGSASSTPVRYLTAEQESQAAPGVEATVVGWGSTREGGRVSSRLREVKLPIVSNAVANQRGSYDGEITARMLAAGVAVGGKDSCQGDSGGPLLVIDDQGVPYLAGIVSWGEGCGRPGKYGIYTRVTEIASWIDEIVVPDAAGNVTFSQVRYSAEGLIQLAVRDGNVSENAVEVLVRTEDGDRETLQLESIGQGRFVATLPINAEDIAFQDGTLNAPLAGQIVAEYVDANDGNGGVAIVTDTARVIQDDYANGPVDAGTIVTGSIISGEIELKGDVDWFAFAGRLGFAYQINVWLDGSLDDSIVSVISPDGEQVLGFDDDGGRGLGSQLIFLPTSEANYFVRVESIEASVGTYTFRIDEIDPPEDDHANGASTATSIVAATAVAGILENERDVDWFTFDAEAGVNYRFDVLLSGRALSDSVLRLFASDGITELAFNDDLSRRDPASRINWSALATDSVFLEVTGFQGEIGTYAIRANIVVDDHGNSASSSTHINASVTQSRVAGELTAGEVDWFSFIATEDSFYEVSTSLQTLQDSILTLYDQDGTTQLVSNDDQAGTLASRFIWQANPGGEFYVEVSSLENVEGSYELRLRQMSPPIDDFGNHAGASEALTAPTAMIGRMNYQGDRDWFRFNASAGQVFTFATELRSLEDTVLTLFDRDGRTIIAVNDDIDTGDRASRIVWTASHGGVYYVEVSGFDAMTGSYSLLVEREYAVADWNQDNRLDALDIDLLFAAIRTNDNSVIFDLNDDRDVDARDIDELLESILATKRGDTNLDGRIDFADFLQLANSYGEVAGWAQGDTNGDGVVDFADFLALAAKFGFNRSGTV